MFKRFLASLLILLLVFNSAGYIVVYRQLHKYFKQVGFKETKKHFSKEELTPIVLEEASSHFVWVKPHEIRYHGSMFDIVFRENQGDSVILYCISDERENILEQAFFTLLENDLPSVPLHPLSKLLKEKLSEFYLPFNPIAFDSTVINVFPPIPEQSYSSQPLAQVFQPPDVLPFYMNS